MAGNKVSNKLKIQSKPLADILILLDRDGTIIVEKGLVCKKDDIDLLPRVAEAISLLNNAGAKVAIVTNQPVVARNMCTEKEVEEIHDHLLKMLSEKGAKVDAVYYCPHHPETNHPEASNSKYRINCDCRKPKPGMLRQASEHFQIPPERCVIVGDHARDIMAGNNFGCTAIFVKTGANNGVLDEKSGAKADALFEDLYQFVMAILGEGMQFRAGNRPKQDGHKPVTKAVILAGGKGTRLGAITKNTPKPMVKINGLPVLEHIIRHLRQYGIVDIVLCIGHLGHIIEDYFGNGEKFGVKLTYVYEDGKKLLGTGGALANAMDLVISGTFIVVYGDLMLDLNLDKLINFHREKGGAGTLTVHESSHPYDSDIIEVSESGQILKFLGKPNPGDKFTNISNAGVYCFEPSIFKYFPSGISMLDKEALPQVLEKGGSLFAYMTHESVFDVGTKDRLSKYGGNSGKK